MVIPGGGQAEAQESPSKSKLVEFVEGLQTEGEIGVVTDLVKIQQTCVSSPYGTQWNTTDRVVMGGRALRPEVFFCLRGQGSIKAPCGGVLGTALQFGEIKWDHGFYENLNLKGRSIDTRAAYMVKGNVTLGMDLMTYFLRSKKASNVSVSLNMGKINLTEVSFVPFVGWNGHLTCLGEKEHLFFHTASIGCSGRVRLQRKWTVAATGQCHVYGRSSMTYDYDYMVERKSGFSPADDEQHKGGDHALQNTSLFLIRGNKPLYSGDLPTFGYECGLEMAYSPTDSLSYGLGVRYAHTHANKGEGIATSSRYKDFLKEEVSYNEGQHKAASVLDQISFSLSSQYRF